MFVLLCLGVVSWRPALSEGKQKGEDIGEMKDAGGSRSKGNCGQEILFERRIYFSVNKNFEYRVYVWQTCHL